MYFVVCPLCNKKVVLVSYGGGWIGVCCDRIVYNSNRLPQQNEGKGAAVSVRKEEEERA